MHIGKGYTVREVVLWTRRDLFALLILAAIPTTLFHFFKWQWLLLPWLPIALLGTAVAFVVGFKNNASYDRLWEARKIWGSITNVSRAWGILVKDFITNTHRKSPTTDIELRNLHLQFYNRHFAWLTALRFQLREKRTWESVNLTHNQEYRNRWFRVEEQDKELGEALRPYLSDEELQAVLSKSNKAAQVLALQSQHLNQVYTEGFIDDFRHMELEKLIVELYNQQGASERIKNFPYPRQYASLNTWFIKIFVVLIPFGMLQEFTSMGDGFVWMTIPFSTLSGWIFTTLERIGESSENPFEGSANDVPITTISRNIEIDLLEMLNEKHSLKPLPSQNNILT